MYDWQHYLNLFLILAIGNLALQFARRKGWLPTRKHQLLAVFAAFLIYVAGVVVYEIITT